MSFSGSGVRLKQRKIKFYWTTSRLEKIKTYQADTHDGGKIWIAYYPGIGIKALSEKKNEAINILIKNLPGEYTSSSAGKKINSERKKFFKWRDDVIKKSLAYREKQKIPEKFDLKIDASKSFDDYLNEAKRFYKIN